MKRLPPRTSITDSDMPLMELLRPLSAKALPRRALVSTSGALMPETKARKIVNDQSVGAYSHRGKENDHGAA